MSLPARTTDGLPLTGAASSAVPTRRPWARTSSEASAETVEESIRIAGARSLRVSTPPSPIVTALRSSEPATIVKTTSQSASAAGVEATVAPSPSSDSAFSRVRFQTLTS